eukprot:2914686-Alexandrium_andersonii.AAC.1
MTHLEPVVVVHHANHALRLAQLGLQEGTGNVRGDSLLLAVEHPHPRVVERLQLCVVSVLRKADAVEVREE